LKLIFKSRGVDILFSQDVFTGISLACSVMNEL